MFSFCRGFHVCYRNNKEVIKTAVQELKELKGAQTIYNPRSSASNYKGYMKAKIPAGLYYNPAQSSAMGSINSETIPLSFLAKDDPRRKFVTKLRANDKLESATGPPVLCNKSTFKGKDYHLEPEQIQEIIKLRANNPELYTRKVLAKKFKVSPLFISLVSTVSKARKAEMDDRLQTIKSKWHDKRVIARQDRKKRKELWYKA